MNIQPRIIYAPHYSNNHCIQNCHNILNLHFFQHLAHICIFFCYCGPSWEYIKQNPQALVSTRCFAAAATSFVVGDFFSNQKSQSRHLINLVAPAASEPWADITKCLRMKKKLKLKGFCHLSSTTRIYVYTTDTLVFTDAVSGPIWSMMKKIRLNSMQRLQ